MEQIREQVSPRSLVQIQSLPPDDRALKDLPLREVLSLLLGEEGCSAPVLILR